MRAHRNHIQEVKVQPHHHEPVRALLRRSSAGSGVEPRRPVWAAGKFCLFPPSIMEDCVPSLVWNRVGASWTISIYRCCDSSESERTVILSGHNEDVWRCREMDPNYFVGVVAFAQRLWKEWSALREDCRLSIDDVPHAPSTILKGRANVGSCQIQLLAHRDGDEIVPTLAFFDLDDQTIPVLYAVGNDDVDRLINDLSQACTAVEVAEAV